MNKEFVIYAKKSSTDDKKLRYPIILLVNIEELLMMFAI